MSVVHLVVGVVEGEPSEVHIVAVVLFVFVFVC